MDPQPLGELFKQAADIAQQMPEGLREVAFQRALDTLLAQQLPAPHPATGKGGLSRSEETPSSPLASERSGHSAAVTTLLEVLDRTELAAVLRGRKVLDRALLLLRGAMHHDIDALTAGDIAHVLTKKFREPTSASAVRMALDRSPSYTDRRPNSGTFLYSLMAPGETYLESFSDRLATPPVRAARPASRKRPRTHSTTDSSISGTGGNERGTVSSAKRPQRSGRPGPKIAIEALVKEGFFAGPRAMSEILSHLKEEKTYAYKTSDMTATLQRMIRQGSLRRSRNAEAQFQYKAT